MKRSNRWEKPCQQNPAKHVAIADASNTNAAYKAPPPYKATPTLSSVYGNH